MWYRDVDTGTTVTSLEFLFTALILPIYLVLTNYLSFKKFRKPKLTFIINILLILFCVWLSERLHFKNWADSVGSWTDPDNETLEVGGLEKTFGIIVSVVGIAIAFALPTNIKAKTSET
jgi:formate hydrogenlyase subunit 3/multisubunit Na+/H+ antiporter MnhD subunit